MGTQSRSSYAVGELPLLSGKMGNSVFGWLMLLALPVRVLLRRNIGLEVVSYTSTGITALFLFIVSWWSNLHIFFSIFAGVGIQSGNDNSLRNFVLFVFLPLAIWQRVQRVREEKRGLEPHTYWHGDGWWDSFLPLDTKYIDMWVDPTLGLLAGALFRYRLGCELLGFWMMVSAAALCVVEVKLFSQTKKDDRNLKNGQKEARERARKFAQPTARNAAKSTSASIPTGADDALAAEIEKRRREREEEEGLES